MAADKLEFHAGISVRFESEEAQGDGVLREWLFLVCSHLFELQNKLFLASPKDPRRYSPNPEPLMEENYLEKYRFAGKILSLALKHNVQVGVLLDPLFFLHLAGKFNFSWQDLIETDLELHKRYKEMLEMNAEDFDALDGYHLTFSGLCFNGENKAVTSANRDEYIHLTMMEQYFHKIRDQVVEFSLGVEDIIEEGFRAEIFFNLLKLEDLDCMLRGSQDDSIDVDQWFKATDYEEYQARDDVIVWFWRVVYKMDQEELHNLLCFWTSHRFLPRGGFNGLPRLCIKKMNIEQGLERGYKPTSQTCCYSLQVPLYKTYEDTEEAVMFITKDYRFSGFGEV